MGRPETCKQQPQLDQRLLDSRDKLENTYNHVGIAYGLHLVDIIAAYDAIEHRVEIIQKVYHLQRCALSAEGCEAHNVAKVDRDLRGIE